MYEYVLYVGYVLCLLREKGGAYGAGARNSAGVFSFFSYRYEHVHVCTLCMVSTHSVCSDPNSIDTLKSFQECIEWAVSGNFSDDDIDEAKLGVFSQVNAIT